MDATKFQSTIERQKNFFLNGATRTASFRIEKLRLLKDSIQRHEKDIFDALHTDLRKPAFESYASEIGFLYDEIKFTIRHLRTWMKPKRVGTPILHFPSSSYVLTEPVGVVLIISAWNYPVQLILAPLIAAIAAGNCAIVKPSEIAPASAEVVERIVTECFTAEHVAVMQGDGAEVIPMMLDQFRFDKIFYTGGTAVGKKIAVAAAAHLTPVVLELGGKSPCIVDEECDVNVAARRIVWGKFFNAGQTCIAPDYVLVHRNIKYDFMKALTKALNAFHGTADSGGADLARIIDARHFERLAGLLKNTTIRYGGKINQEALFIQPTVIEIVDMNHPVMGQEIFGPILPVIEFDTLDSAMAAIRERPFPLSLYLFTNNKKHERRIVDEIQFGGGCVNNTLVYFSNPNLPFGGVGSSGNGRYHGKSGFDVFSHQKSITRSATWLDIPIKYPPYKSKLKWLRMFQRP